MVIIWAPANAALITSPTDLMLTRKLSVDQNFSAIKIEMETLPLQAHFLKRLDDFMFLSIFTIEH